MKIAMMVRGYLTAPGPKDIVYAPIDLAVAIAEGLVKRGHKVDFYGPKGTKLKSGVKTFNLRPLVKNQQEFQNLIMEPDLLIHYIPALWDHYLVSQMFKQASHGDYDLLYFMHPEVALTFTKVYPEVPVAYTLHDPIFEWYQEIFKMYHSPNQYFISISKSQRLTAPSLKYIATIHNGVDLSLFPFSQKPGMYLLYVGRMLAEKGIKEAIEVAEKTNHKLLLIGPSYATRQAYFNKHVKPHLGKNIKYLGHVRRDQLWKYYQNAKAFLAPIKWEEPFGLTMIEAMACGTPVVALNRASTPEIVVNGKTGFVVNSVAEMVKAVDKIDSIDRRACREHVENNFSIDRMVDDYELIFKKIINLNSTVKRVR